jgi:signal transduction histidine kinase
MRRRRSLRWNALLVVLAVALFPLVYVLVSATLEQLFAGRTLGRARASTDEVAAALGAGEATAAEARIEAVARARSQRVRIVRTDGKVLVDFDHAVGDGWLFQVGDVFYGPGRAAGLQMLEEREGPLASRPEIARALALATSDDGGCEHSVMGNLDVCHVARKVELPGAAPVVVHVQGISRRALEALYDSRRQLVKLTSFVLALGLLLAWWMGKKMVRPVETLREEVLGRARAAVPGAELAVVREDEVGDLTLAFNALLGALSERASANQAFLQDLAHELKNPVAAIRACAERIGEPEALDDTRRARLADVLVQSSRRLDALVTQFLELARAEAGLPNEGREDVDMGALAAGLTLAAKADARFTGVTFEAKVTGDDLVVRGVQNRLESALRNLVDNAASFAGDGGKVEVAVARDGDAVEIAVSDTGPGIAEGDLPRVFERFFTKREREGGTGLGLALVRAVVHAHEGTVRAESPPGSGARFVIRLTRR